MDSKHEKTSEAVEKAITFAAAYRANAPFGIPDIAKSLSEVKSHIGHMERGGMTPGQQPLSELLAIEDKLQTLVDREKRKEQELQISPDGDLPLEPDREIDNNRKNDSGERINEERNGERQ